MDEPRPRRRAAAAGSGGGSPRAAAKEARQDRAAHLQRDRGRRPGPRGRGRLRPRGARRRRGAGGARQKGGKGGQGRGAGGGEGRLGASGKRRSHRTDHLCRRSDHRAGRIRTAGRRGPLRRAAGGQKAAAQVQKGRSRAGGGGRGGLRLPAHRPACPRTGPRPPRKRPERHGKGAASGRHAALLRHRDAPDRHRPRPGGDAL